MGHHFPSEGEALKETHPLPKAVAWGRNIQATLCVRWGRQASTLKACAPSQVEPAPTLYETAQSWSMTASYSAQTTPSISSVLVEAAPDLAEASAYMFGITHTLVDFAGGTVFVFWGTWENKSLGRAGAERLG